MTRTEEKLKLAEELGIEGYVQAQKQALKDAIAKEEREAVIKELTGMKWRPLTEDSFKFFPKRKFVNRGWFSEPGFLFGLILSTIPMFLLTAFLNIMRTNGWVFSGTVTLCVLSCSFIAELLTHIRRVQVSSMPLSEWKDDLPYGALLAVKEAKGSGVVGVPMWKSMGSGFKIYYPRLEQRRVNADPIITGLYKGIEVEIFAWDDKKIRPEDY